MKIEKKPALHAVIILIYGISKKKNPCLLAEAFAYNLGSSFYSEVYQTSDHVLVSLHKLVQYIWR